MSNVVHNLVFLAYCEQLTLVTVAWLLANCSVFLALISMQV